MLFLFLSHHKKTRRRRRRNQLHVALKIGQCSTNNVIFSNDNSIQPCDLLANTIIWLNLTGIPKGTTFEELYLGFTHWKSSDSTQTNCGVLLS